MKSERGAQADLRLAAPLKGYQLFRNNVGVLNDARGIPVRFGLANDSKPLNRRIKSADLIGWRSVVITPDMVGKTVAIFVSREMKDEGWKPPKLPAVLPEPSPNGKLTDFEHFLAQVRWARMVTAAGGDASFATGVDGLVNPTYWF